MMDCEHKNTKSIPRIFKNETRHVEIRCFDCGNFIKFEPTEKSDLEMQNWKMPIGKYQGKTLRYIAEIDLSYLNWCTENLTGNPQRTVKQYLEVLQKLKMGC